MGIVRDKKGLTAENVPQGWTMQSLGENFDFKNGLNKGKEYFGHGTPIVNYMDVYRNSGLRARNLKGRVDVNSQELKAFAVRKGDVFFTRTSETVDEIGIASVFLDESPNIVFSGFVLRARPITDNLVDSFKRYCFSASSIRKQIVSQSSYTTRALTNGRALSSVLLNVPPKDEQKAIAQTLGDFDELIDGLDALIQKKRDIKQAAMQQLLSGKSRLNGFAKPWEEFRFGELAYPRRDRTSPEHGELSDFCIELEDIQQGTGELIGESSTGQGSSMKTVFLPGDVLFGKLRAYLRKFWLADRPGVCSTEIWALVSNRNLILPEYLFQIVRQQKFIDAASVTYGTHMPRSDWNVVKQFMLRVPYVKEQHAIAEVLSDMDVEIAALGKRRDKTQALKLGVMNQLLSGNVRLI